MPSPSAIPSLRTELLVRLAVLTAAAILLAVAGLVLLGDVVSSEHGTLYVGALLTADLVLVVAADRPYSADSTATQMTQISQISQISQIEKRDRELSLLHLRPSESE